MKKSLFIALFLTLGTFVKAQTLDHAINQLRNENFLSAKKELLKLLAVDNSGINKYYLANAYLQLGDKDSALFYYTQCSEMTDAYGSISKARVEQLKGSEIAQFQPHIDAAIDAAKKKNAEIYFQVGLLAFKPEAYRPAMYIQYVEKALELEPANKYYKLILGDLYRANKQGGDAVNKYEEVLAQDPNNVLANIRVGRIYYAASNYPLAISYLEKANSIDPSYSIAHKELGELYYLTNKYDKAREEFKTYISLNDNDAKTKAAYSGFLYQLKEYDKAIEEVGEFLKTDSNNYIYYKILAFCHLELKNVEAAQYNMTKFWEKVPKDKAIAIDYTYAGKIANANSDTANAVKYMRQATQLDTNNADVYSEFGILLFNTKRYQEAVSVLNKRVAMYTAPTNIDYYYLGRAHYAQSQWALADSAFSNLVRIQPEWADGHLWRAKCNYQLEGDKIKGLAFDYYQKYIELASSNIERNKSNLIIAYYYMGIVYMTRSDKENAKASFSKILEIDPENKDAKTELSKLK